MFFDEPAMLHSSSEDGRHWLTSVDVPPLQILPVEGNQCRVAHALALLLSDILAKDEDQIELPCELTLTRAHLEDAPGLGHRFRSDAVHPDGARVRLEMRPAPPGVDDPGVDDRGIDDRGVDDPSVDDPSVDDRAIEDGDDDGPDDDACFITPVPPADWRGSYDDWLFETARTLGLEPPAPLPASTYEQVFAEATAEARRRLPELRRRFLDGMDGLNLGLKAGLRTDDGGIEYVWVRPVEWPDPDTVVCILESEPYDCSGYQFGQQLSLRAEDIADYGIGSEEAGLIDPGLTQQIAEDYGLVIA